MTRYAIFYAPPPEQPLSRLGASLLGYDLVTGADVAPPDDPVFDDPMALGWTAVPRTYGFHATMKAPMHLAGHASPHALEDALVAFCRDQRAFTIDLTQGLVGHTLALVLATPSPEMDALAAACVRHFEAFRAPLTPEDRERRHPERLTAGQVAMLDTWGYPHVLDQFQFHMTLSSELGRPDRERFEPVLRHLLAAVPLSVPVNGLMLCRQEGPRARFVLQRRAAFAS